MVSVPVRTPFVLGVELTLITQRAAQEHQVASLQESVELALLRYTAGRASYFEVLEAEQLLFPAQDGIDNGAEKLSCHT